MRTRMIFDRNIYYVYLINGDLIKAMDYVERFPDEAELYERIADRFERGNRERFEDDEWINSVLNAYQTYYMDVFYLRSDKTRAENMLRRRLVGLLGESGPVSLDGLERDELAEAFARRGFHFMGGRTDGYYGPYIWSGEEAVTYNVELPGGVEAYTVKLLDGFISKSWLDYISFGELGTGGWTGGDGVICCVRQGYDVDGEDFRVSLVKHEAQHARDLRQNGSMASEELEYRAKLVELIYSAERKLLPRFAGEADGTSAHALASRMLVEGFAKKLGADVSELESLPICQVRAAARELFAESDGAV